MEIEKRIVIAMTLFMIIYMLFMYKQVSVLEIKCKNDNESLIKRFDENEEIQENMENKLNLLNSKPASDSSD